MDGLLLVNKPKGITSFDIIRRLRKISAIRKIGHAGTLDPMATGLVLMLFGTACKKAEQFNKLEKTYLAEITLGATSSTGDAEGTLTRVERSTSNVQTPTLNEIRSTLNEFEGVITQTPSVYSAIKINGQEAYKRARRGEVVEMPSRLVTVYKIQDTRYKYPILEIEASVSSGTYIRSLAEDIGTKLGTGAYLSGLVRTHIGGFELDQAIELDALDRDDIKGRLQQI